MHTHTRAHTLTDFFTWSTKVVGSNINSEIFLLLQPNAGKQKVKQTKSHLKHQKLENLKIYHYRLFKVRFNVPLDKK